MSDVTTPFSSREVSLPTPATQWTEDDCLPIILNFRQDRRVSLSPRSGRNERSEWRTARRAVDRRGSAAPLVRRTSRGAEPISPYTAGASAFRFTWLDLGEQPLQLRDQRFFRAWPPIVLTRSDGASPVAKVSLFSLGGGERKK